MTTNSNSHSLSGSWRGHYTYARSKGSYGFEAVLLENNGAIDGNILDDGRLGEAAVTGSFTYPQIEFTKSYYRTAAMPVKYQGTMSEDGNTLTGTWYISSLKHGTRGTWVAKRYTDAKEIDLQEQDSQELKTERQLVETHRI